jgi:hypothetical protein
MSISEALRWLVILVLIFVGIVVLFRVLSIIQAEALIDLPRAFGRGWER